MKSLDVFKHDARKAMLANPDYFVKWYTVKSIALVVAIGTAAYFAGKSSGMQVGGRGHYA